MKTTFSILTLILAATGLYAQGTAFTYQGRLNAGNSPANGTYDLVFTVYASASGINDAFANQTNSATSVSNGLFTVTLNLGDPNIFTGEDRWLEIAVRTNGTGGYAKLSPRQKITPTPYAITAGNLVGGGLGGTYSNAVTFNNQANNFSGNGGGLTNVNAVTLGGLSASNVWKTGGNAGTTPGVNFLGSTDNQPLVLKVNNAVALRIDPATYGPNMVGGLAAIQPTVMTSGLRGAVVAGGGAPAGPVNGFGGGDFHAIYDSDSTIGGGFGNKVGTDNGNVNDAPFGTVGGGVFNTAANYASTVAGGDGNYAAGARAAIGGGAANQAWSLDSVVAGGVNNIIMNNSPNSAIGGGYSNLVQRNAPYSTIAGGTNNFIQYGLASSTIGGGAQNSIFVGGTPGNLLTRSATIGGGWGNRIYGTVDPELFLNPAYGTIGGGCGNTIYGYAATVPGGCSNVASGDFSLAAGARAKATNPGSFVWADSQAADFYSSANNDFSIRASGGVRLNTDTSMFFGSQMRQMLNLWSTQYGIGVQTLNTYFRSDFGYSWFKGGVHNDAQFNPGAGGTEMMRLDPTGLRVNGTFVSASDRNLKENFERVDSRAVLEKVAALPVSSWNYKSDQSSRHLGPMAQDFYAAFGVGPDDKHITTVDESGVALAAIQGLNEKVQ